MATSQPLLNLPGNGRKIFNGKGTTAEIAIDGEQTHGDYSVIRFQVAAGDEPPLHSHSLEDEIVYVEKGEIVAIIGDQHIEVGTGAIAALPKDLPHTFKVIGESASLIITLQPAGAENFFVPRNEEDKNPDNFGLTIH